MLPQFNGTLTKNFQKHLLIKKINGNKFMMMVCFHVLLAKKHYIHILNKIEEWR